MKKIALITALVVLILLLTKIANEIPPEAPLGTTFVLRAQKVIECTPTEITLLGMHDVQTHLDKDDSWPACSIFSKDEVQDFYLSRGAKTHFQSKEPTSWWRKAM
jgi:hypothetical protein